MGKKIELSGRKFNMLTVIERDINSEYSSEIKWICQCDCGNKVSVRGSALRSGKAKSCGCYKITLFVSNITKHKATINHAKSPEYSAWDSMKARCYNVNYERYHSYGGRGIQVCERWRNSFENFYSDMGPKPSPDHSLDRFPNNDGDYEPGNCRWATEDQQKRNMRSNNWMEYNGESMIVADWSKKLNIPDKRFRYHVEMGKSIKEIIDFFEKKNKCQA